jgi:hypothetical protein
MSAPRHPNCDPRIGLLEPPAFPAAPAVYENPDGARMKLEVGTDCVSGLPRNGTGARRSQAGLIFWFKRRTFFGSYFFLIAASRV